MADAAGNRGAERRGAKAALAFAAFFLLSAAPLAHLLRQSGLAVLSAEAGLAAAAIAAAGAAFALLHGAAGATARALLEALLVALAVDLVVSSEYLAAAAGAAAFLIARVRRVSLLPAAAVMGGAMLATTLAGLGGERAWIEHRAASAPAPAPAPGSPALLHILLDEQIGIEGLPAGNPASAALGEELRRFFLERGFVLYGRAYSEHLHTANAVPHILNFGVPAGERQGREGVRVGRTAWLDALTRRGFRLRIYQSDFADLCSGAEAAECHSYAYASLHPLLDLPMSRGDRARTILMRLLSRSRIVSEIDHIGRLLLRAGGVRASPLDISQRSRTSSLVAFAAFDRLSRDLRGARPGDAFIAHLLVPHFPYVVDARCRPLPRAAWQSRLSLSRREVRESAYFEQVRCTMRRLDAALAALAASPAGANAIVVVHGDHGSKIADTYPDASAGRIADADLIAGFSTLFALRAPGIAPAYVEAPAPVAALLRGFERSGLRAAPAPGGSRHAIWLDDADWNPQRRVPFDPAW